jgi:hypothetical protein
MHPDSRHLIGIAALILVAVAGCSALPRTGGIDWNGAHPFTLSNRVFVKGVNPDSSFWSVQYEVDGLFKIVDSTGSIYFRIDRLEMNKNPKYADDKTHLDGFQIALCYYREDIRRWDISPKPYQVKTNLRDLSLPIELNKTYRITDIGVLSIPKDLSPDLHKAWPCGAVLLTTTGPTGKSTSGEYVYAHEIALTTIL